jgi:uncharacterized alpha-E superfamily protein
MLSRIAESLYWMSRYLERVDHTARFIEINRLYMLEAEDAISESAQWRPLLAIVGADVGYAERHPGTDITARRAIQFMVQDRSNPGSLHASLQSARENARAVRDRISRAMWEGINELWLYAEQRLHDGPGSDSMDDFLSLVRREVALFHGQTVNTMMRGQPFAFYLLGTFVERADMTARLLDVKYHLLLPDVSMVGSALDYYQWAALLKSISGFEAYRRKYHTLRPLDVAEFVLFDAEFPRSLAFSIERMVQALAQLNEPVNASRSNAALERLRGMLIGHTAESIFEAGLHEFLEEFLAAIATFNEGLQTDYFEAYLGTKECTI